MLTLLKSSSRRHPAAGDESSQAALRHHRQGAEALEAGDLEGALFHFRMGLGLSPLNRALREALAEALSQAADSEDEEPLRGHRFAAAPTAAPRMGWEESDDDWEADVLPPAPPKRPSLTKVTKAVADKTAQVAKAAAPKAKPRTKSSPQAAPAAARRAAAPLAPRRRFPKPTFMLGGLAFTLVIGAGVTGAHALLGQLMPGADLPVAQASAHNPAISAALREANAALLSGEAELAAERLRALLTDHPQETEVVTPSLVMALRAAGGQAMARAEYAQAAAWYTNASVLAPEESDNWLDLGHAHRQAAQSAKSPAERLSSLKRAETAYRKALDVAREPFFQASAHASLAQVQMLRGDTAAARASYQQAKTLDDGAPQVRAAEIMMRAMNSA
ncbi:MAG: hypothetical protein RLY93_09780 [Sumerlaeia bacterium]